MDRERCTSCDQRTLELIGAERLADEVAALVLVRRLDARSGAGDALLDYRDPPQSERSKEIAQRMREATQEDCESGRCSHQAEAARLLGLIRDWVNAECTCGDADGCMGCEGCPESEAECRLIDEIEPAVAVPAGSEG